MLEILNRQRWLRINVFFHLDVQIKITIILPAAANFYHEQKYTTSLMEIVQSLKLWQALWDFQYLWLYDKYNHHCLDRQVWKISNKWVES